MADRFSTPPRRVRSLLPPSPIATAEEMNLNFVVAMSGTALGRSKVTATTRLYNIRPSLVSAMGGSVNQHEIYLMNAAGRIFNQAFSLPFEDAAEGDTFTVVEVEMSDMVYLDMSDRRK